jgi:hypothetical protein
MTSDCPLGSQVSKNWSLPLEGSAEASKLAALATLSSTDVLSICPACAAAANASAPVLGGRRPGRAQPTDAGPLMLAIGFVLMVFLGCAQACRGYFRALKTTRLEERLEALSSARRAPKPRGSSMGGGAVGVVGGRAVGKSLKAAVGKSLKAARGTAGRTCKLASSLMREAQMDSVSEDEELPLTKPLTAGGESSRERPLEVRSKERCGSTAVRAKGAAAGGTAALAVTKPAVTAVTKPAVTALTKPAVTKPAASSGGGSSSGSTSAVSSATKAAPTRCVAPKLKPPPPATVTVPSTSTTPAQSRTPTVTKKAAGTFGGKGAAKLPKAEHPAEQDVISFGKNFGKK